MASLVTVLLRSVLQMSQSVARPLNTERPTNRPSSGTFTDGTLFPFEFTKPSNRARALVLVQFPFFSPGRGADARFAL